MNGGSEIPVESVVLLMLIAFLWGGAAKTLIDGCFYAVGVRHGWRIAHGDIDSELDEARRVLQRHQLEDSVHGEDS